MTKILSELRRAAANHPGHSDRSSGSCSTFSLEPLEPRMLLSADLAVVAEAVQAIEPAPPPQPALSESAPSAPGEFAQSRDLVVQTAAGTHVTFRLTGAGVGTVENTAAGWSLRIGQTERATTLSIETSGGDGRVALAGVTVDGPLAAFGAPNADMVGSARFTGSIESMTLGYLRGVSLTAPSIQLLTVVGNVEGSTLAIGTDPTGPMESSSRHAISALFIGGTTVSSHLIVGAAESPRSIGVVWFQGGLSMDSTVAAAKLPTTVLIAGQPQVAAADGRFTTEVRPLTPPSPSLPAITKNLIAMPAPVDSESWSATVRTWEQDMVLYGRLNGDRMLQMTSSGEQIDATYYDAVRVYTDIATYTGDPTWLAYLEGTKAAYRDHYVIAANGAVPGYWNFTTGLRMDFERTGDVRSRDAALLLADHAMFAIDGTPLEWTVGTDASREVAYSLAAYVNAEKLGQPHRARMDAFVDQALGHIDQWFVSNTAPYIRPFMVGITMHALIDVYEHTGDSRVPGAIQIAADGLWNRTWLADQKAFMYTDRVASDGSGGMDPAPDLNLLIAPAYAWLYRQTGNTLYRDRGDAIFSGGVEQAFLNHGKQFNQNYLWSFDYLTWRAQGNTRI